MDLHHEPLKPGSEITAGNIKRRRKELGLTQKELGQLIGVSDRAVRAWETDEAQPEGKTRQRVADILALRFTPARRLHPDPVEWPELEIARQQLDHIQHQLEAVAMLLSRMAGPTRRL